MIVGIGADIVNIARIEKAVSREAFIKRVFTDAEKEYCLARGAGCAASFAGRFAAKEAFMKALGTGLREGRLTEIEIKNDELGAPQLELTGIFREMAQKRGVEKIWLSISHEKDYAVAQCVLEG